MNEQTVLTMLHTIMIRNHNLIARQLGALNPHWSDETIFQETRNINIAIFQHITFNEFLPLVLGKQALYDHDLVLYTDGYYDGYDPNLDPGAAQVQYTVHSVKVQGVIYNLLIAKLCEGIRAKGEMYWDLTIQSNMKNHLIQTGALFFTENKLFLNEFENMINMPPEGPLFSDTYFASH